MKNQNVVPTEQKANTGSTLTFTGPGSFSFSLFSNSWSGQDKPNTALPQPSAYFG